MNFFVNQNLLGEPLYGHFGRILAECNLVAPAQIRLLSWAGLSALGGFAIRYCEEFILGRRRASNTSIIIEREFDNAIIRANHANHIFRPGSVRSVRQNRCLAKQRKFDPQGVFNNFYIGYMAVRK